MSVLYICIYLSTYIQIYITLMCFCITVAESTTDYQELLTEYGITLEAGGGVPSQRNGWTVLKGKIHRKIMEITTMYS